MVRLPIPSAPKCARCGTSVYLAEQVIGPSAKPYHKACLTCIVCNKRLDSSLLVEHDGEPYCKNCHREHLGTGKGGFGTSVPIYPTSPTPKSPNAPSLATSPTLASPSRSSAAVTLPTLANSRRSETPTKIGYSHGLASPDAPNGISFRSRGFPTSSVPATPPSPSKMSSRPYLAHNPSTPVRSIDEALSYAPSTPVRSIDETLSYKSHEIHDSLSKLVESVGNVELKSTPVSNSALNYTPVKTAPTSAAKSPFQIPSVNYYATPSPECPSPLLSSPAEISQVSSDPHFDDSPIILTRRVAAADTIGSNRNSAISPSQHASKVNATSPLSVIGQLPSPRRPDPKTLTGAAGTAKIASPRTNTNPNTNNGMVRHDSDELASRRTKSGIERLGLSSIIVDAGGGTPLCARCQKLVYFAEQKAAAGRKWHRGCLRCDACSTTLESGKLEEGPTHRAFKVQDGANVWCRICYAKYFGPKNLSVGLSLPEAMR